MWPSPREARREGTGRGLASRRAIGGRGGWQEKKEKGKRREVLTFQVPLKLLMRSLLGQLFQPCPAWTLPQLKQRNDLDPLRRSGPGGAGEADERNEFSSSLIDCGEDFGYGWCSRSCGARCLGVLPDELGCALELYEIGRASCRERVS